MGLIGHRSRGNPCEMCGALALKHARDHDPDGNPCSCGAMAFHHCPRKRPEGWVKQKKLTKIYPDRRAYYVGIDGEGQGKENHKYILLAYSNDDGQRADYIENVNGLSTVECLDFILSIPGDARPFAYAFNYDMTKILTDVDDKALWKLFRPETRQRLGSSFGPRAVTWGKYSLNLQGSKFTVRKKTGKMQITEDGLVPLYRSVVIWDIFKFFQGKFTTALEDWKVGEKDVLARMRDMKDMRAEFDKLDREQIRKYCFDECRYMAQLAQKLTLAHEAAGLSLKSFYGAGSTASCILKKIGIDKHKRETPNLMQKAVSCAFFGGRFENSVIGEVEGPVWGYDISSAYPYQTTFLPCLECGTWTRTKSRKAINDCTQALVRYKLHPTDKKLCWGPFPYRFDRGSITFPVESGGGWVYKDEYIAGEKLFDNVEFIEAWVYNSPCDHQPFSAIPQYYIERLRIGKEGPGIVIKLGVNACYGKLAQSTGFTPPFRCLLWAGMITSGTRGQLLDVLGKHRDWSNLLMIATDGVYSRERLPMDIPRDTGTMTEHKKPLGGWEEKEVPQGLFLARPGVYFPLNPTEAELKQVRARGVGRGTVLKAWEQIVDSFNKGLPTIEVNNVSRFMGAKSCISFAPKEKIFTRSDKYGQWITRPIVMSFDPKPKREWINEDRTLETRKVSLDKMSEEYSKFTISKEALEMIMAQEELMQQPDADFSEYDNG